MSATPDQRSQLAVLDRLAVLTEIDGLLQAVITSWRIEPEPTMKETM